MHPGALLREDVLPALRASVTAAAEKLGVSQQTLHAILAERAAITPEMAVRIGKFCGNGPAIWLTRSRQYRR
jgi:addiction module HigA family antidote